MAPTVRVYVNGKEQIETEVEEAMIERKEVFEGKIREKFRVTEKKEEEEKQKIKEVTTKQAEAYFLSKAGIAMLKNDTQEVMESADFQALGIGDDLSNELQAMKERRSAALKQVKANYITNLYVANVRSVKEKYTKIYDELNDRIEKRREEGAVKMRAPCASAHHVMAIIDGVEKFRISPITAKCCHSIGFVNTTYLACRVVWRDAQRLARHGCYKI